MAETMTDVASTRRAKNGKSTEDLEMQIERLRDDIRAIGVSLSRLSERKMAEVKGEAEASMSQLVATGQSALDAVGSQASALEGDLKRMVRDKPLTAIATAMGIGFILAVLSRR